MMKPEDCVALCRKIACMHKDGEITEDGEDFAMFSEDAMETLERLIDECRQLTGECPPEYVDTAEDKAERAADAKQRARQDER